MTDRRIGGADLNVEIMTNPERRVGAAAIQVDYAFPGGRTLGGAYLTVEYVPIVARGRSFAMWW